MSALSIRTKALIVLAAIVAIALIAIFTFAALGAPQREAEKQEEARTFAYIKVYHQLESLTDGTSVEECIKLYGDTLKAGDNIYVTNMSPISVESPNQGAQDLLAKCAYQSGWRAVESASENELKPYFAQGYVSGAIDLPEEKRLSLPNWEEQCSDSATQPEGFMCVIDGLNLFEHNVPLFVAGEASLNQQRWQLWSEKWSQPPSAEVAQAMSLLRQIVALEEESDILKSRLTAEACTNSGIMQEAALWLTVERYIAETGAEPGVAANHIYNGYFGDDYGFMRSGICVNWLKS